MIRLTLDELATITDGRLAGADPDVAVEAVTTDSRTLPSGPDVPPTLFVARRGEQQDGHDHAPAAVEAGAVGVLAGRALPDLPCVVVADPDEALRALARHVRDTVDPLVVGVTGSVGKTTTKDLVHATLASAMPTEAATGSYNNEMGVPLTLLRTRADTRALVVEMGARGVGQVAPLARLARPDVGIVTAVAAVHLELFGSLDAIAQAKGELVEELPATGTAVLNADDPRVAAMADRTDARVLRCSAAGDATADLQARDVRLDARGRASFVAVTPWGDAEVTLPVAGKHHVANALYALAAAGAADADLATAAGALCHAEVSPWRAAVVEVGGVMVLDDAYNANPTATTAALDTLAAMQVRGRRVAVLGVMAEIGDDHDVEHWRVGSHAAGVVDRLLVVGRDAQMIAVGARDAGLARVQVVDDVDAAIAALADLGDGDALLVKASRVVGLDRVTAGLRDRLRTEEPRR